MKLLVDLLGNFTWWIGKKIR